MTNSMLAIVVTILLSLTWSFGENSPSAIAADTDMVKANKIEGTAQESNAGKEKLQLLDIAYSKHQFIQQVLAGNTEVVSAFLEAGIEQDWIESKNDEQRTLLMSVAAAGNGKVVAMLLKAGAGLESRDQKGRTALFYAAKKNRDTNNPLDILLEHGANIAAEDSNGETALFWACWYNQPEAVSKLLAHGTADSLYREKSGRVVMKAVQNSRFDVLRALIDGGADLNYQDVQGTTPLMHAIRFGKKRGIEMLLAAKANLSLTNVLGQNALIFAISSGDHYLVQSLVDGGANVNFTTNANSTGSGVNNYRWGKRIDKGRDTPLIEATKKGSFEMVRLLIKADADLNIQNGDGNTALLVAAANGNLPIVRILLEAGADPSIKDNKDQNLVAIAIQSQQTELLEYIGQNGGLLSPGEGAQALIKAAWKSDEEYMFKLLAFGVDPNVTDFSGTSVLMAAIRKGCVECVDMLIFAGADVDVVDKQQNTPLNMAARGGNPQIAELLIQAGVDLNTQNKRGMTALGDACGRGKGAFVTLLIEAGADIHGGRIPPLENAAGNGKESVVRQLLEGGANVNYCNKTGGTALMAAARKGRINSIKELLEQGADINAIDGQGRTALIWTVDYNGRRESKALEITKLLLATGGNQNIADKRGDTALSIAQKKKLASLVTILEKQ